MKLNYFGVAGTMYAPWFEPHLSQPHKTRCKTISFKKKKRPGRGVPHPLCLMVSFSPTRQSIGRHGLLDFAVSVSNTRIPILMSPRKSLVWWEWEVCQIKHDTTDLKFWTKRIAWCPNKQQLGSLWECIEFSAAACVTDWVIDMITSSRISYMW